MRSAALLAAAALGVGALSCGPAPPTPTPVTATDGVLTMELRNYVYIPETLEFARGETVEFRMTSVDELHTFTVPDLGINWSVPKQDEATVETFRFTRPGTYSLICIVSGHEGSGMVGTITVTE